MFGLLAWLSHFVRGGQKPPPVGAVSVQELRINGAGWGEILLR